MEVVPDNLKFLKRPLSWTALSSDRFYKIFRNSDDPDLDIGDPIGIAEAEKEYAISEYFGARESHVNAPTGIDGGCLIYPLLSGPDMVEFIKREDDSSVQTCLNEAIAVLGRLHRLDPDILEVPLRHYKNDPWFPPTDEICDRMESRRPTIVTSGFEIRNFRYDESKGRWMFFDPHHVKWGLPEEDFARFVLSLLMINWGRHYTCVIWKKFDLDTLIEIYQDTGPVALDREFLRYAFGLVLAMRKRLANRKIAAMGNGKGVLARIYLEVYFYQIRKWMERHGVSL